MASPTFGQDLSVWAGAPSRRSSPIRIRSLGTLLYKKSASPSGRAFGSVTRVSSSQLSWRMSSKQVTLTHFGRRLKLRMQTRLGQWTAGRRSRTSGTFATTISGDDGYPDSRRCFLRGEQARTSSRTNRAAGGVDQGLCNPRAH